MSEPLAPPTSGVSLFEAVLARWLVELSGRHYVIDEGAMHGRSDTQRRTVPGSDGSDDMVEVDDRFPGLGRLGRLLEVGAGHLDVVRTAHREQCRQAAIQARALAAFATARPAGVLDRSDDEVGAAAAASRAARPSALTEVSEWAVDEVMVALSLSSRAAGSLLADSVTLAERLPATLDALEEGRISFAHARALAEIVGPVKDEVRADVEARLLARVEGKTVSQLREAARRAVLRADAAAAAKRLARALRERSVRLHPGNDGMAELTAVMSLPVARACWRALEAYAEDSRTPGDERTKDQRITDCLVDLILRPGINGPVQIGLTVVAGVDTMTGGDEPGEVDGYPVPAIAVRELAYALGLLPRPEATSADATTDTDTDGEPSAHPVAGARSETEDEVEEEDAAPVSGRPLSASEAAAARLGELLGIRTAAGTPLAQRPTIAVVDEISGQLLALTDATAIRQIATCRHRRCRTGKRPCTHAPRGPGLGPPTASPGYSPADALARFVRARDRRCRFPGCRAAAIRCDLDHNQPWPAGATSADNLCCLCRHHHRLSHQAPGWTMSRLPDGGLRWTTPSGDTTTHPLRYGSDDDLAPAAPAPPTPGTPTTAARPLTIFEQLRRWPPPPPDPDDPPAPF